MPKLKRGFSLIELMVVTAVIAILATLIVINTRESRMKARDVNRKQSVGTISLALEQRFTTTKSYFVSLPGTGTDCAVVLNNNSNSDPYMDMVVPNARCVGYKGGGAGRVNAKAQTDPNVRPWYPNTTSSIDDALYQGGYLASIPIDPSTADYSQAISGRDFLLTLCDSQGNPATSAATAVNYGVFSQLESSTTLGAQDTDTTNHSCGAVYSQHPFDYWDFP